MITYVLTYYEKVQYQNSWLSYFPGVILSALRVTRSDSRNFKVVGVDGLKVWKR